MTVFSDATSQCDDGSIPGFRAADDFRHKAAQYRRIADGLDQDDPVVARLRAMAVEFEMKAVLAEKKMPEKQVDRTTD